jgi:SSS family solute:Na+ symporter
VAPILGDPRISNSIFAIIQEGQAYIYSGILAVFLVGVLIRRAPPSTGVVGLLLGPISFWVVKQLAPEISFVNRASISFGVVVAAMLLITAAKPLPEPVRFQTRSALDLTPARLPKVFGVVVVLATIALYVVFL